MDWRRIFFDIVVAGNPSVSVQSSIIEDYQRKPEMKTIVCKNSKKKAEESLLPTATKILDKLGLSGEAMTLTGDCGLMEKVFAMGCFENLLHSLSVDAGAGDISTDNTSLFTGVRLPNLMIMLATLAANCGVNSKECYRSYCIGPPPSLYNLVQEMGCVDRARDLSPGFNWYDIHLS